ncbi:hypothetical protein PR048_007636 [Dryococelus australis]|uniref:Uncharacterized protein n=1 Tax=Dryococelus australis TaxID=614101 RepID=A0ABQ9HUS5_9NEOP|nr:hypothetical protein PR048_007636 [Dryococelus australis]
MSMEPRYHLTASLHRNAVNWNGTDNTTGRNPSVSSGMKKPSLRFPCNESFSVIMELLLPPNQMRHAVVKCYLKIDSQMCVKRSMTMRGQCSKKTPSPVSRELYQPSECVCVFPDEATIHISRHDSCHCIRLWSPEYSHSAIDRLRNNPKFNVRCYLDCDKVIYTFPFAEKTTMDYLRYCKLGDATAYMQDAAIHRSRLLQFTTN